MTSRAEPTIIEVSAELTGIRLDLALARLLPAYSRSRIRQWIDEGLVQVAGRSRRPRDLVLAGERISITMPDTVRAADAEPQAMDLEIVYEDEAIFVVNKPVGLVVHPGAGNPDRTLQNALLARDPRLAGIPRAGIVHRLDKDTSGLLVIARTLTAQTSLVRQLAERSVHRAYEAVCVGVLTSGGTIEAPIARHRVDRKRMTVRSDGRAAVTHYRVIARFRGHTHLKVELETGRTHQIRVHLAHIKAPIVGDPVYGGRLRIPRGATPALAAALKNFKRQALHAARLEFDHPLTGERVGWSAALPRDMADLLKVLRADAKEAA